MQGAGHNAEDDGSDDGVGESSEGLDPEAFDPGALTRDVRIEFALLADAVQAVSGKLYVLGGGWDTLAVRGFPARHPGMGIALRFRVPWSRRNEQIELTIDLVDEDGHSLFKDRTLRHRFTARQPAHAPDGAEMGVVRAFTFANVVLPAEGSYAFIITVDERVTERLQFRVRQP